MCRPDLGIDMATSQIDKVISHVRTAVLLQDGAGLTDGQLLEDYLSRKDEAALAALVRRHGPMVWGVCQRVVRNYHDAEDAFQSVFLVLVRKAPSISSPQLLANWLYGVAHQTALKARAVTAKRRTREKQVAELPEPAATEQQVWNELRPMLDRELSRLPEKYRVAIVLCGLEGKTRKEAATQLGVPDGTVAAWLARGRRILAKRLARRGLAVSGTTLASALAERAASASAPGPLVSATIEAANQFAANLFAAGRTTAGVISVKAAALTDGVLQAMFLTKLKKMTALISAVALAGVGTGTLWFAPPFVDATCAAEQNKSNAAPEGEKPEKAKADAPNRNDEDDWIAWGKAVHGVQAGLAFRPAQKGAYRVGATASFVVKLRNGSDQAVEFCFQACPLPGQENEMLVGSRVLDVRDMIVPKSGPVFLGGSGRGIVKRSLAAGEEIEFALPKFMLGPVAEPRVAEKKILHAPPGAYRVNYYVYYVEYNDKIKDYTGNYLSTGLLHFEIKEAGREADKPPQQGNAASDDEYCLRVQSINKGEDKGKIGSMAWKAKNAKQADRIISFKPLENNEQEEYFRDLDSQLYGLYLKLREVEPRKGEAQPRIRIECDKELRYSELLRVMEVLRKMKLTNIAMAAIHKDGE